MLWAKLPNAHGFRTAWITVGLALINADLAYVGSTFRYRLGRSVEHDHRLSSVC